MVDFFQTSGILQGKSVQSTVQDAFSIYAPNGNLLYSILSVRIYFGNAADRNSMYNIFSSPINTQGVNIWQRLFTRLNPGCGAVAAYHQVGGWHVWGACMA